MPVLILLEPVKNLLNKIKDELSERYEIEVHTGDFQTTKQELSNLNKSKLYILLNCDLKPFRYEMYCLVKKQEDAFVVLNSQKISTAKHDNPCVVANSSSFDPQSLVEHFDSTLKCSTAHKKKIVGGSYTMKVKEIINRVNSQHPSHGIVLRECESRLMKMLSLNPVDLKEIEACYSQMIQKAIDELVVG